MTAISAKTAAAAAVVILVTCLLNRGGSGPISWTSAGQESPPALAENQTESQESARPSQPDVIVVGAGISGLTAALELGRGGARVIVVDMSSVYGGHAVMSQGSVSIVDTPAQKQAGIQDSPQLAFDDFHRWGENPNTEWVRYYTQNSRTEIHDWLLELGVQFSEVVSSPGNSVPREHQPIGRGIGLVTPIYRACLELDQVTFEWNAEVVRLKNHAGRISGVTVRDVRTGEEREISAANVILATGGFQNNLDMVREFWPREFRFPERILTGSGRNSTGRGHRLAQSAGGQLSRMEDQWNYFTGLPDPRSPGSERGLNATNLYGILVNSHGRRFVNFHAWAKVVMPALLQQDRATCWCVFDESSRPLTVVSGSDWADFRKVDREILQNPELVRSAQTVEELAKLCGLPPQTLRETVDRYNALVATGEDADFGRFGPGKPEFSNTRSPKIVTPPFYAMQTYPLTRKSMGGVAIDLQCRVVDSSEQPVPGLYAVGELAGLAGINGKAALEGTFLGPCVLTGRLAARSILTEMREVGRAPTAPALSRCQDCHTPEEFQQRSSGGYWHFQKVHSTAAARAFQCVQCHSELSPYRDGHHRIDADSLTANCVLCHTGRE